VGSGSDNEIPNSPQPDTAQKPRPKTSPTSPSYVAPIPKIGHIPPISPTIPSRPQLPPYVGSFLLGKTVDEAGDIRDDKTGQLLARAGGDLPSIVGRKVSNRQGDILGEDGELLGYVADIEIERKGSGASSPSAGSGMVPRSLFEVMGRSNSSLMVDAEGNILDAGGNVVGKFHDNNNPMHRQQREREMEKEGETRGRGEEKAAETGAGGGKSWEVPLPEPQPQQPESEERHERPPRRTEEERRQNAQAWRKENPGESPSDIFLDVKSTTEGIQLTIRIPTVFGSQQVKPNITFS